MNRSYITKGKLTLEIDQIQNGTALDFEAEDITLEIRYTIPEAALREVTVAPVEVAATTAIIQHDAIFETGEDDGLMILARKGADLSVFIHSSTWRSWQEEIAQHLNTFDPDAR